MEELCRQICVINDIDERKCNSIINIIHIVGILVKLVVFIFVTLNIMYFVENNMTRLLEFIMKHDYFNLLDNNEVSSGLYLIIILFVINLLMLVLDIIDLAINSERGIKQLLFIAAINYCSVLLCYAIYTIYDFSYILLMSLFEPMIFLFLVCVVYIRMQYNRKIYHKMIAEEQKNRVNLSKRGKQHER